jgi:hypothetical protein
VTTLSCLLYSTSVVSTGLLFSSAEWSSVARRTTSRSVQLPTPRGHSETLAYSHARANIAGMEIPIPSRYPPPRDFGTLPSISHDDGFHGHFGFSRNNSIDTGFSPSNASHPMSIQNSDSHMRDVPPPLPPPRLAPVAGPIDPNLEHFKENPMYRDFDSSPSDPFDHMSHRRRDPMFRSEIDEGYQSIDAARSVRFTALQSAHSEARNECHGPLT